MVLTYAAYLMLRAGIENAETRRRFAAVYGILAIITALAVLIIPRILSDTIHPVVIGPVFTNASMLQAEGGFDLAATAGVGAALGINFIIWALLVPITLMWHRIRLENHHERVAALRAQIVEQ
ncbi:MAG: hypothetical protein HC828_11600 [Blastochloris sp.]|nr:hypothetical protein [Blastochloris sp.]